MAVVGLDLAALSKNPTGFCLVNKESITKLLYSDEEIINEIEKYNPNIVAIDAPLSLPKGKAKERNVEKQIRKLGIGILSPSLPAMRKLALRAISLKRKLNSKGITVIETFPYAVLQLNKLIAEKDAELKFNTKHERDAHICALVAQAYVNGRAKKLGDRTGMIFY
ncbi:MAG TPA: DUF429 domain-containing protein [bacterium (Candidatus Stahlbacteria)]|nr:DUF429 domain-containing protein [Candidatus Stahlbacteria bacterium]